MAANYYMPTRICFGKEAVKDLQRFLNDSDRVLIVTDKGLQKAGIVDKIVEVLECIGCRQEVYDDVEVNPRPQTVEKCLAKTEALKATAVIGLGGGSPLDVAKIVSALATNEGKLEDYQWNGQKFMKAALPFIAIPTTAGTGSEVTRISVIVDRNVKKGIVDDRLYPTVAIVDPILMATLPSHLTSTTGLDAFTHAVEAYVGLGANSFSDAFAMRAIRLLIEYLPKAFANGDDLYAREQVAKASTLAGIAMDQAGLGIIHAMSSPAASYYDIAHGLSNAVLLPHGMRFNVIACPEKLAQVAHSFGINVTGMSAKEAAYRGVEAVEGFCRELQAPVTYEGYSPTLEQIERFGREAAATLLARNNPRKVKPEDCVEIFKRVFSIAKS